MSTVLFDTAMRPARAGRVTGRTIQIGLGLLWLIDGLLQLQTEMFGKGFADNVILPATQGQPALVSSTIRHVIQMIAAQPALVDAVVAAMQILIGVGLLIRQTVRPALVLSFVWALGVWSLGEGFGMLFTGMASPQTGAPGAALLYLAIGVLVWPRAKAADATGSAASEGPLREWGGKAIWAVVWSSLGILWLLPANRAGGAISDAISNSVTGEPAWLSHIQLSVANGIGSGGSSVAVACGILSFMIGLGPLLTRHVTIFLVAGTALALDYWVFGEAFGGLFTGLGTDPNTGPLLILLALTVYPNCAPVARRRHLTEPGAHAGQADIVPTR